MATVKKQPDAKKIAPLPTSKGPTMPKKPTTPVSDAEVIDKTVPKPAASTGTALVSYKERMAALVATTKKAEAPQGGFLSTKGGRLSNGEVRLPGDKIRAIVVEYRKDNEFYPKAYEPNTPAYPICHAVVRPQEVQSPWRKPRDTDLALIENDDIVFDEATGLVADCEEPQVPAGRNCDSCPMLEWGSAKLIIGKTGSGKGKACRESRRLHLFAADQCTTPTDVDNAPFMTLIPPPTSLDNFKRFANEVTEVLDMSIFGAVVEIEVKPHDQYQFMVHYKIVEAIKDEGILMALLNRHEQIAAKQMSLPKASDNAETKDARGSKF